MCGYRGPKLGTLTVPRLAVVSSGARCVLLVFFVYGCGLCGSPVHAYQVLRVLCVVCVVRAFGSVFAC